MELIDTLVYKCRKTKINFCLDKGLGMISLDMSELPWWERAFKKKQVFLWDQDIKTLREFVKAYDECKGTKMSFY